MRNKQNIVPLNEYGQKHGLCISYYNNGNIWLKQRFVNGVQHGIFEDYWDNRKLGYKGYRIKGKYLYTEWHYKINRIEFKI